MFKGQLSAAVLVAAVALGGCNPLGELGAIGGQIMGTSPEIDYTADPIRIWNDEGGNPFEYEMVREKLIATGKTVEIGECNSACTILMSMPNACLIPGARFGFHSANIGAPGNAVLAKYYRAGVLELFETTWSKSSEIKRRKSERLVQLDPGLRLCER